MKKDSIASEYPNIPIRVDESLESISEQESPKLKKKKKQQSDDSVSQDSDSDSESGSEI